MGARAVTFELLVLAGVALCVGSAAAAGKFATPGPPPDIVGAYVALVDDVLIAADGSFIYQSSVQGEAPYVGRYLSHQCNPDGSWYVDYLQYFFDDNGYVNKTVPGCGTGYFVDGLYTSKYALTETAACPISATAQTETAYHQLVPGSGLGELLDAPYCSPLRRGLSNHAVYTDRSTLSPLGFVIS